MSGEARPGPAERREREAEREPRERWLGWYAIALLVYITGGYLFQSILLNWLIGPLFLLITLYLVPTLGRALVRRVRAG